MSSVTSGSTAGAAAGTTTAAARRREAEREETRDRRVVLVWLAAIGVGVLALGASVWRLMPGIGFWDTAEFQMVGPVMGPPTRPAIRRTCSSAGSPRCSSSRSARPPCG